MNFAFPIIFSNQSDNCIPFVHIFDIIFLFTAEMEKLKTGIWGKGLMWSNRPKVNKSCMMICVNLLGLIFNPFQNDKF